LSRDKETKNNPRVLGNKKHRNTYKVLRVFLAPIFIGVTQYISACFAGRQAYRFNESLNLGTTLNRHYLGW